jgi:hypothetical protein
MCVYSVQVHIPVYPASDVNTWITHIPLGHSIRARFLSVTSQLTRKNKVEMTRRKGQRHAQARALSHPEPSMLLGSHHLRYNLGASQLSPMTKWPRESRGMLSQSPRASHRHGLVLCGVRPHLCHIFSLSSHKESEPTKQGRLSPKQMNRNFS